MDAALKTDKRVIPKHFDVIDNRKSVNCGISTPTLDLHDECHRGFGTRVIHQFAQLLAVLRRDRVV